MKKSSLVKVSIILVGVLASLGGAFAIYKNHKSIETSITITGSNSESSESNTSQSSEQTSEEVSSEETSTSESEREENKKSVYNEPYLNQQYYLNNIGNIFDVWQKYSGKGVTVAVIDVGFTYDHEDFINSDGTSQILDTSASFTYSSNQVSVKVGKQYVSSSDTSHGTFCAGIVGAANNNKGTVGIAFDSKLMLLKTDAKPKSICEAFKYASDNGAKVVTISIGSYADYNGDLSSDGSTLPTAFDDAVSYARNKGTVIISAAGNGGLESNPSRKTEFTYPGASKGVIGAAGLAANSSSLAWSGSSQNPNSKDVFCDIYAPADDMFGICNYRSNNTQVIYDGGWEGTSFASPIVAGAAALYFEKNPSATVDQFEADLYLSAHQMANNYYSHGRLDVSKLLNMENHNKTTISFTFEADSWWNQDNACSAIFLWNDNGANANFPGVLMNKNNGKYTFTVDTSIYDYMIISRVSNSLQDWGAKTIDLNLSQFKYHSTYKTSSSAWWNGVNGAMVGRY